MSAGALPKFPALGFIELSSISRGLYLTDLILKKAPVRMLASHPISSGKHILLYMGDVASVDESHREALSECKETLVRETFIPGIHPDLATALESPGKLGKIERDQSVGIIESKTVTGAILSCDAALKSAHVSLFRMRLGQGIGGKAYFVLSGDLPEVQAALEASQARLTDLDSLCRVDLIARPDEEALIHF